MTAIPDENIHDGWFGERSQVTEAVVIEGHHLSQNSPHDFAAPRLWQARCNMNHVRRGECADGGSHLLFQRTDQFLLIGALESRVEQNVGIDALALDGMWKTNDGGLSHCFVGDKGALDFRCSKPVS
jgi:hypothetical protein